MLDYIWFWLARMIAEALPAIVFIFLFFVAFVLPRLIQQARCRHRRYMETRSCDAICIACGKNLGFIQTQRERNPKGEQ